MAQTEPNARFGQPEVKLGVIGRGLTYFNFQVLHALGRPWAQVSIGFVQLAMNALFAWMFMQWFGLAGIAMGSSLSLIISVFISYALLSRLVSPGVVTRAAAPVALSIGLAALTFGVLHFAMRGVDLQGMSGSRWGYAALTGLVAALGLLVFFTLAMLARMNETRFVADKLRKRFPGRK